MRLDVRIPPGCRVKLGGFAGMLGHASTTGICPRIVDWLPKNLTRCLGFDDLHGPQAVTGATDIAMRQHLPPDILAFTATKPMFEQLCALDERSFLHKPFWQRLRKARA